MGPCPRRILALVPSPPITSRRNQRGALPALPGLTLPSARALPLAVGSAMRAGREGCFSPGNGAAGLPAAAAHPAPNPAPRSRPRPRAAAARTWWPRARLPCSFRLVMSCSCFSSSELFILAGWVGNERKGGRGEGVHGGGGRRSKTPVACGSTTRKSGLLPLLLLQARSGRVSSSPRTYSAARAASPAGGPRGGGEDGGGVTPAAARPRAGGGSRAAPAVAPGSQPSLQPLAAARLLRGGRRRRVRGRQGEQRACGPARARAGSLSCTPSPRLHSPTPDTKTYIQGGQKPALDLQCLWEPHFERCSRAGPREPPMSSRTLMGNKPRFLPQFSHSGLWGRCGKT